MKKIFIISIIFIFIIAIFFVNKKEFVSIKIGNTVIKAEIAKSRLELSQGLGGRKSLSTNEGMLFVFDDKQERQFWMKDMDFPIDIIWIDGNRIVGFEENVPILTDGEITRMNSKKNVNYVLEVSAGFVENNRVKIGDKIEITQQMQ